MKWALLISVLLHALIWRAKNNPEPLVWRAAPIVVSPSTSSSLRGGAEATHARSKLAGPKVASPTARNDVTFSDVLALGNEKPVYPAEAQRAGWEGEVLLRLSCEKGKVTTVAIEKSSGYTSLDEAARTAALNWKFPPDRVGREAKIPIQFKLD